MEETQRRPQEGRERTGILKIREQYAQSVQQIRDTIHIQLETQFDAFSSSIAPLQARISAL
jgi:tRNA (Thr-GGU) A37 N-methylase